jgi:hypothetical protein
MDVPASDSDEADWNRDRFYRWDWLIKEAAATDPESVVFIDIGQGVGEGESQGRPKMLETLPKGLVSMISMSVPTVDRYFFFATHLTILGSETSQDIIIVRG